MANILLFTFWWSTISFFFPFFLAFFWVEHILLFHFILSIAFITLPLPAFCGFYMNYNMYHSSLLVILCIIEGTYIGTLPFPSSPLCNCYTFHSPPFRIILYNQVSFEEIQKLIFKKDYYTCHIFTILSPLHLLV